MNMKKSISILLSLLLLISLFSACSTETADTVNKTPKTTGEIIDVVYPYDTTVDFHTQKQASYLSKEYKKIHSYAKGKKELSKPEPVTFSWIYNGEKSDDTQYILNISESKDMANSVSYTSSSESIEVYNLKLATSYYWTVTVNEQTSDVTAFQTTGSAPRNMYVDGVTNVRDLGGWETESGKRTKQGLIFRCGRLNESSAEKPNIEITENGIKTMRDEMGIRTEIDLRKTDIGEVGGITSSPLGEDIHYFNCPMEWEGDTFNGNKEELLKVFSILSEEQNYPLIFHCNIGTDRTGMIAFLVNALLGVPEEDLYRDYLFSNFGDIGGSRNISGLKNSAYYEAVQKAAGNSLSEKTYNCLVDFGVPKEQLDSIIAILSGE